MENSPTELQTWKNTGKAKEIKLPVHFCTALGMTLDYCEAMSQWFIWARKKPDKPKKIGVLDFDDELKGSFEDVQEKKASPRHRPTQMQERMHDFPDDDAHTHQYSTAQCLSFPQKY